MSYELACFLRQFVNTRITQSHDIRHNFFRIEIYVYYEFLGALAAIVQLHFVKMQMSAAAAKTWKIVWRYFQLNGCFKTFQQLPKHILGAHVGIAPSRSVKLETTQTSALVVKKWISVLSHCQMNGCLKAWKLKNV